MLRDRVIRIIRIIDEGKRERRKRDDRYLLMPGKLVDALFSIRYTPYHR